MCPLLQALAARAVQILQYILMAVVMFGDHIFPMLGVQPPELYHQVKDKKFGVIMGAWLIGAGPCAPPGVSTVSLCGCLAPTDHLLSDAAPPVWCGDSPGCNSSQGSSAAWLSPGRVPLWLLGAVSTSALSEAACMKASSSQAGCNASQQDHLCGAGNMLNNSLKSTGAFEVYYNGQQV